MKTIPTTRRTFLQTAGVMAAGGFLHGHLGCAKRPTLQNASKSDPLTFNIINVKGSPFQCGLSIGRQMSKHINRGLQRRRAWFEKLKVFAKDDPNQRIKPYLEAAREHYPDLVEELKGMAEGARLEFEDLFIFNLKAELSAMRSAQLPDTPGCSTLIVADRNNLLIAHNEDGNMAYRDLMCLVRVKQEKKPAFVALSYPGILCGNGPATNSQGLFLTTNYIAGSQVRPGVPRYFLSRAILQAADIQEAIAIATHPQRAYAFHYNLGLANEKKIYSIETSMSKQQVYQVNGLYQHTNHLVLTKMANVAQDQDYINKSSMSRLQTLIKLSKKHQNAIDSITLDDLQKMLASHEGIPTPPCRHPDAKASPPVTGMTLATALFDVAHHKGWLIKGQSCTNPKRLWPTFSYINKLEH
jgi:hypothetical protein